MWLPRQKRCHGRCQRQTKRLEGFKSQVISERQEFFGTGDNLDNGKEHQGKNKSKRKQTGRLRRWQERGQRHRQVWRDQGSNKRQGEKGLQQGAQRLFCSLVTEAGEAVQARLVQWHDLCQCIYVYDDSMRQVEHAALGDAIPWPVILVLSSHHHKMHMFGLRKVPAMQTVNMAIQQLIDRVSWQWHFKGVPKDPRSWYRLRSKAPVQPYIHEVPISLRIWTERLRHTFFELPSLLVRGPCDITVAAGFPNCSR